MNPQAPLAPNQQALKSFEVQTLEHPADIRPQALANPFVHMAARLDGGDIMSEASEKLQQLVSACMILNKKGSMTFTVAFAPGGMNRMELSGKITAKIPEGEAASTSLFCTPDGQLTAYDPAQPQFQQPIMPAVEQPAPRTISLPERSARIIDVPSNTPTTVAA